MSLKILSMINLDLCTNALAPLKKIGDVDNLPVNRQVLLDNINRYDAYFGHTDIVIDEEILSRAERLKVIAAPSTGTDHIDVELLRKRGIELLALTREYELLDTFTATAECAWGLLLAAVRQIPAAVESVNSGIWGREFFTGRQLAGKTLGVLGVGRLGKMVVEYGKAFRMRVLGHDIKPFQISSVESVDFNTLIKESDIISIHIHLSPENKGIISEHVISNMKNSVVIVNTSRGALIDEVAFLTALKSGKIASAGIDIINGEWLENINSHPLVQYAKEHRNLIITPHIGGATVESIANARIFLAKKLAEYLQKNN